MHPVPLRRSPPAPFTLAALLALCLLQSAASARQEVNERSRSRPRTGTAVHATAWGVPTPSSFLGFTPGDDRRVADWTQITDYFKRLDRASDRVLVRQVGESTLGKPLIAAFISAPENIRELDKYRDIQRRLADPRLVASDAERDRLVREGKTVVVVSCSIHSTEIVASQKSMHPAHGLATAPDADTRELHGHQIGRAHV